MFDLGWCQLQQEILQAVGAHLGTVDMKGSNYEVGIHQTWLGVRLGLTVAKYMYVIPI